MVFSLISFLLRYVQYARVVVFWPKKFKTENNICEILTLEFVYRLLTPKFELSSSILTFKVFNMKKFTTAHLEIKFTFWLRVFPIRMLFKSDKIIKMTCWTWLSKFLYHSDVTISFAQFYRYTVHSEVENIFLILFR